MLLFEPGVVVTSVPFHLPAPEVGPTSCRAPVGVSARMSKTATPSPAVSRSGSWSAAPCPSGKLEHTLLPKVLALPVFSSDALSSVAYASDEILRVLLIASIGTA